MADLFHQLRTAYSARDPSADAIRRDLARDLVSISDASAPLYELLCLVAEQAWHRGEQCRAESLLRRAILIADTLDLDSHAAVHRLASWIADSMRCDPDAAHASPPTCTVIRVDFSCALMRLELATLDHVQTMTLDDRWLLVTPIASGGGKLAARCAVLLDGIMAHNNRGLAATAPYDPNFIGVRHVDACLVRGAELPTLANSLHTSPWTSSSIFVIDGDRFAPVGVPRFLELVS